MAAVTRVQALYAELRRILGDRATTREALAFATSIVKFCLIQRRRSRLQASGESREGESDTSFECLSVDAAMQDGGWKILEYELDQFRPDFEVGRVQIYEMALELSRRMYAAETAPIDAESDRLLRSLEWLLDRKGLERRHGSSNNFDNFED